MIQVIPASSANFCKTSTSPARARIREALAKGNLPLANELLGMPYMVQGEVVHGNEIGRTLDMPTANQIPDSRKYFRRLACMLRRWRWMEWNITALRILA